MVLSRIKQERSRTAEKRFYVFNSQDRRNKYPFVVCDSDMPTGEKVIGRFKSREIAELFAETIRYLYVNSEPALTKPIP